MSKLKKPLTVETVFDSYVLDEIIGQGGAARVYGGTNSNGDEIALKLLTNTKSENRRRFKNEINFLYQNEHPNIVSVIDFCRASEDRFEGIFYIMPRYTGSLRNVMATPLDAEKKLQLFSKILDGVEAAHLQKVIHRDLKPENILLDSDSSPAVADFGIARFHAENSVTMVQTSDKSRLANFQYAAPEQRAKGKQVGVPADIYALGLIANELFTGEVPNGTDYKRIADSESSMGFMDDVVAEMIKQQPDNRPGSIVEVKSLIERYRSEAINRQKLHQIKQTVIPEGEIDDPLALHAPELIDANYENGQLTLVLDRPVHHRWVQALRNLGSYGCVSGIPPSAFHFREHVATVSVRPNDAQRVINYFKAWLKPATNELFVQYQTEINIAKQRREQKLAAERERLEQDLKVNQSLKI